MSTLLVTALALAASTPAQVPGHAPARCEQPAARKVDGVAPRAGVRKLGEMPPAKQYLTVLREVDGCPKPVVLREGIGARR